ncbi:hypothetical protein RIF29_39811 [Crotalaria pallida]|uniref:Mitochondrial import inner membrane translocase subunit TIM50 n=1 Tax=Crotalaria pallida TaxID=3830 RepID=A0AAN9HR25_CROPI
MARNNKSYSYTVSDTASSYYSAEFSESEDDFEDVQDQETVLGLSLEKLNLGPRKKLLVLNLNNLLVNKIHIRDAKHIPSSRSPDATFRNFFGIFEVGIWASSKELDQDQCLDSGFFSLENKHKPLFFKELKKVWEKVKKGGPYSASNSLLIDDKPYKAFLNAPNTAIFPESYKMENKEDKILDPKGELCSYLEGLADANDVQSYVKENLFGQPAITSSHTDFDYYSKVKESLRRRGYR